MTGTTKPTDGVFIDLRIVLPEHVHFSDLCLEIGDDGEVRMDATPVRTICEASGLDPEMFLREGAEMDLARFVQGWYAAHLARGGRPNPVLEELHAFEIPPQWPASKFIFQVGHA